MLGYYQRIHERIQVFTPEAQGSVAEATSWQAPGCELGADTMRGQAEVAGGLGRAQPLLHHVSGVDTRLIAVHALPTA